ncbi:unnamed protein product [Effrenium voratum]|uniref:Uncharacterized protein n=1 Tax=Effrenium voratum TaxID=2562239 RepID=A0AA36I2M8_9DINO|nr:unnamed protein product [Effrenium voratum]
MCGPEPKTRRPILSQENLQFVTQPGWERHEAKAPNVKGEMAEWKQLTPRGQRKQARDVGTLLLRVPLPPAPHLVHGRGAPPVPAPVPAPAA